MFGFMKLKEKLSSFQIIILGFISAIVLGALLLMLPISTRSGTFTSFGTALFTATSAVCVTGLVVVDTASYWSLFGQLAILSLIQIGGLGVITVASSLYILAGRKISLMQRQTMQNAFSAPNVGGMVKLTRFIIVTTFVMEGAGALLLCPVFIPRYGIRGSWMALFHAVSAFCNAGFDLMGRSTGPFSSFTFFADHVYLNGVICILIVLGGIGFITWSDIATRKFHVREYKMQTKVILSTTAILIILPAVFFFFNDFFNEPMGKRICLSLFQSITPRTAGFNTADLSHMSDAGKAVTMLLMLIGGSPGSTAGGMKTTTIAVLFANTIAVFRKRKNANYFGRRLDDSIVKNASTILFMYMALATLALIINIINNAIKYTQAGSVIKIEYGYAGTMIFVRISDNGPGMDTKTKEHAFDMFYTGQNKIADSKRSMGIGLALCRSVVEAHGGRIEITDNEPSGCIFTLYLEKGDVLINE